MAGMKGREWVEWWRRMFVGALCVGGVALCLVALIATLHTAMFLRHSVTTMGTVVNNVLIETRNDNGTTMDTYAPVFKYEANDGRSYTVQSKTSSMPAEFAVGQRVRILYDPRHPSRAKPDSFWQLWTLPLILGILGIATSFAGFSMVLYWRRRGLAGADG